MKHEHEWPLGNGQEAAGAASFGLPGDEDREPLLPLAFDEHVELIKASPAIDAFARKRASQILTHGHTPEADLEKSIGALTREAKDRLHAIIDIVGPQRLNCPPMRRAEIVRKAEIAGACLIALWERLQIEVPEE